VKDDLVIARPGYDNYIVAIAVRHNVSVVDATETVLAVHQTDTELDAAGWRHKDRLQNHRRIGSFNYGEGLTSGAQLETRFVFDSPATDYTRIAIGVYKRQRQPATNSSELSSKLISLTWLSSSALVLE